MLTSYFYCRLKYKKQKINLKFSATLINADYIQQYEREITRYERDQK